MRNVEKRRAVEKAQHEHMNESETGCVSFVIAVFRSAGEVEDGEQSVNGGGQVSVGDAPEPKRDFGRTITWPCVAWPGRPRCGRCGCRERRWRRNLKLPFTVSPVSPNALPSGRGLLTCAF